MADRNQIRGYLDGLAELSRRTGLALTFGGSGSESILRFVDREGSELFEVKQLEPSGFEPETGRPNYQLHFTGVISFSSISASTTELCKRKEPEESPETSGRYPRISASVVLVRDGFGANQIESTEPESVDSEASLVES